MDCIKFGILNLSLLSLLLSGNLFGGHFSEAPESWDSSFTTVPRIGLISVNGINVNNGTSYELEPGD